MRKFAKIALDDAKKIFGFAEWPVPEETLKKKYRMLSLQHHPDREGGSHEKMQEVNNAAETLFDALSKEGKTQESSFSQFHSDLEKSIKEYKNIDHEHNESTAEVMDMEEKYKKMVEHGHVDLAKLDANGVARLKIGLKGGGFVILRVLKEGRGAYKAEVDSVSSDATEDLKAKLTPGKVFSTGEHARRYYYTAEKYRNFHTKIKEKKKSLSRQKAYKNTFENKEEGVAAAGTYYTTDPSAELVGKLVDQMMRTNVLKVVSRGPRKGKIDVGPAAMQDLAKSSDANAKFIAGVAMMMRGHVDSRVTSNVVGISDAEAAANAIAQMMVTGSADGLKKYEKENKLNSMPSYEKDLHPGKNADQVHQEAHEESMKRYNDPNMAKSDADYAKKHFEDGKEHREKGVHKYNGEGNYSDKFKEHHGDYVKKQEEVRTKKNELLGRMAGYAKMIAQVLVDKKLMNKANLKNRLIHLADYFDTMKLKTAADIVDGLVRKL